MKVDSLDELRFAFAEWRRLKKHARERMPEELVARARLAANAHGVTEVVRVTEVERARLFRTTPTRRDARSATRRTSEGASRSVPSFSRLELSAPSGPSAPRHRPVAEVETRSGVTLRVFEQTSEMLGLLTAVCGFGGAR